MGELCRSTAPTGTPPAEGTNPLSAAYVSGRIKVPCELEAGHEGLHRHRLLTWHDPPLLLVGGEPVDVDTDTERWKGGEVVLEWDDAA